MANVCLKTYRLQKAARLHGQRWQRTDLRWARHNDAGSGGKGRCAAHQPPRHPTPTLTLGPGGPRSPPGTEPSAPSAPPDWRARRPWGPLNPCTHTRRHNGGEEQTRLTTSDLPFQSPQYWAGARCGGAPRAGGPRGHRTYLYMRRVLTTVTTAPTTRAATRTPRPAALMVVGFVCGGAVAGAKNEIAARFTLGFFAGSACTMGQP